MRKELVANLSHQQMWKIMLSREWSLASLKLKNGFVACKPPVQNLDKASWPPVKSFNTKGCLYVTGPTIFS